ncbi:MAG: YidC/Oxa1 family insertase periplasmic-domain containing protein, partial [Planctomycetota bacterium]
MEKRLAIALVLCIAWIVLAQQYLWPPPERKDLPENPRGTQETASGIEMDPPGGESDPSAEPSYGRDDIGSGAEQDNASAGLVAYESTQIDEDQIFEVDTPIFRASFLNRGAVLTSLQFKDYFTSADVLGNKEAMADPENWLEIIREVKEGKPSFGLRELAQVAYKLDEIRWEHVVVQAEGGGKDVVFSYRASDGLIIKKTFSFLDGAFHLNVKVSVENRNPDLEKKLNLMLEGPCGITDRNRASFT